MKFSTTTLVALSSIASTVCALSPAQWRGQSIYQVMVDRFARTDGSTTATCNSEDQVYCGGTWQGLINKLDYIQGMGFTAVSFPFPLSFSEVVKTKMKQIWISPIVQQLEGNSADGESYHGYWAQNINAVNSH